MMKGLEAVHKAGIAHRDLKPQNLLLDVNFCIKITDFGLSKIMETEQDRIMKTTYVGTRGYQAPELLKNQKYTNACDVFSMGVVLFILLAGYPPFEAAHKTDKWYKPIAQGDYSKFWHVHRGAKISDDAKDLMEKMLHYRPSKRAKVMDILEHKWFKGDVLKDSELKERIIGRFAQARENRKKDAKKVKDLIESEHQRDVVPYKPALETRPADLVPMSVKLRSLTPFFTREAPYTAIWSINNVLLTQCKMITDFNQEAHPHKLKCKAKQAVPDVDNPEIVHEFMHEFSVQAYQDPDSVYSLIHIQPLHIPDSFQWRRVYKTIMEEIFKYDILVGREPAIVQEEGSRCLQALKAQTAAQTDQDDQKDDDSANPAVCEPADTNTAASTAADAVQSENAIQVGLVYSERRAREHSDPPPSQKGPIDEKVFTLPIHNC